MSSKSGGIGGTALKILGVFVVLGFIVALLRVFNWDPFGVIDWIIFWITTIITSISDWFGGNEYFQAFTNKRS